jgi:hypothetical protein
MQRSFITLKVSQLALDPLNPRFETAVDGDMAALGTLIKRHEKKLLKITSHISTHGLSPLERLMVHPIEGGRYLADEGNRRTSALKLLNDPGLAQAIDEDFYKKLKRIVDKAVYCPEEVDCVIVQSEKERKVWLNLRHMGENGGSGTSSWGTTEAARYMKRYGGVGRAGIEFGLRVMELVLERSKLTESERVEIRKLPLTTFERMLADPAVRSALGIDRNVSEVFLTIKDEAAVLNALKELALDVARGVITARIINSKEERTKVVSKWSAKRKPGLHGEPIPSTPLTGEQNPAPENVTPDPGAAPPKRGKSQRSPDQRTKLIPTSCLLNITDKKVQRIYIELKKLDVEGYENAVSVLLRVFLELSVDHFLDKVNRKQNDNAKLKTKMAVVDAKWIESKLASDSEMRVWRTALTSHTLFSLNTLHGYIHSSHSIPTRRELVQTWDKMEFYIKLLWP